MRPAVTVVLSICILSLLLVAFVALVDVPPLTQSASSLTTSPISLSSSSQTAVTGSNSSGGSNPSTSTGTSSTYSSSAQSMKVSLETIGSIPMTNPLGGIVYDQNTDYIYVAKMGNRVVAPSITVVNASGGSRIIGNITLANSTESLLYDPWNGYIYASQLCERIIHNNSTGTTADNILSTGVTAVVIQGTKIVKEIVGPCASGAMAYDPADHHIFEASADTLNPHGVVNVIDDRSNEVVATTSIDDDSLAGIAFNPDNRMVYIADFSSGSVHLIDPTTNRINASVTVESGPNLKFYEMGSILWDPWNHLILVSTYNYVTVMKGSKVVGTFSNPPMAQFVNSVDDVSRGVSFRCVNDTTLGAFLISNDSIGSSRSFFNVTSDGATTTPAATTLSLGGVCDKLVTFKASQIAYDPTNQYLYVSVYVPQIKSSALGQATWNLTIIKSGITTTSLQQQKTIMKASTYSSRFGLELTLTINSTSVNRGDSISVLVSLTNELSGVNNISVSSDWPVKGLSLSSSCGTYQFPYGLAIMQGYYDLGNVSADSPPLGVFRPYDPNVNATAGITTSSAATATGSHCPFNVPRVISYSFEPSSNMGVWEAQFGDSSSSAVSFKSSFVFAGYLTSYQQPVHPFPAGWYTVVGGDEWGQLVILHFEAEQ